MFNKLKIKEKLPKALEQWRQRGVGISEMAFRLEVSITSINSWRKGRRVPRIHTLQKIESLSGIQIL